ncbi:MAG: lysophospholipid acyltransferase family protein, partial [Bacteroidetes bacterium]|nr:lysophospholipid acyltransferase family protein [Bacteroidota bacterium]
PFPILYLLSDFFYIIAYYIVGYRKKVVRENLRNSFPELNAKEIRRIEKAFYRHFTDFLVESVKTLTISNEQILKRCAILNPELVQKYYDEGRSVMVLCGHYNNWEYYAVGLAQQMKHKVLAAYQPLKNQFFNQILLKSRQRYGIKMMSMKEVPRKLVKAPRVPTMSIMVNDQSPHMPKKAYWNTFLNQPTGWMTGTERLAAKLDQAVLFGCIRKRKRGFYEVTFYPISEHPAENDGGEILDQHAKYLEMVIAENPEYWLWSHKRWKHKKPL